MVKFYCCICESAIRMRKSNKKLTVAPICYQCRSALTAELGPDWESSDWWQEYKRMHYREQKGNNIYYAHKVPYDEKLKVVVDIDGVYHGRSKSGRLSYPIIRRLYQSYNIGNRKIYRILRNVYKINVSRRTVANILQAIKHLPKERDSNFWKTWLNIIDQLEEGNRDIFEESEEAEDYD